MRRGKRRSHSSGHTVAYSVALLYTRTQRLIVGITKPPSCRVRSHSSLVHFSTLSSYANSLSRDAPPGIAVFALLALLCLSAAVLPNVASASGSISGTVTDAVTKAPIEGLVVCAHPSPEDGSLGGCSTTDLDGKYMIILNPRSYTVVFEGGPLNYGQQWHDHRDNWSDKESVVVGSDPVTGIDAKMKPFGRMEGAVREEGSGLPVENARVCAQGYEGDVFDRCTSSDATGHYVIANLRPGKYIINFWPRSSNHLWQYYDHKEHYEEGDPVSVGLNEAVTEIDADVPSGAGAEGVVQRAGSDKPFLDLWINIWPIDKETFWPVTPKEDGRFSIVGLPPGEYKVEFLPRPSESKAGWKTQFWNHKANWHESATLSLTAGTITTGIDADMELEQSKLQPQLWPVVPSIFPMPRLHSSPLQRVRRVCPSGFRKKRKGNKVRCVRKHKRHRGRHSRGNDDRSGQPLR